MKGSMIILGFFVIGIVVGVCHWMPSMDALGGVSNVSYIVMCALIFVVGFNIGCNKSIIETVKSISPLYMLLPLMTIVGTLAGSAIVAFFLPGRSIADCLAVGSGMGCYSLSSIFITQYKGPELGTVALLANIVRELITLLGAPLLIKCFGKLAPIAVGGATTMDTTLPILNKYLSQEFVIISIFHGFITDFTVPFLVTLFCEL